MFTLDKRQTHVLYVEQCKELLLDPNNNFDPTTIWRILDDTNHRHNLAAPDHNVNTLTNNAAMRLNVPRANLER